LSQRNVYEYIGGVKEGKMSADNACTGRSLAVKLSKLRSRSIIASETTEGSTLMKLYPK
jgi:hypothetical protein